MPTVNDGKVRGHADECPPTTAVQSSNENDSVKETK
jgi:hypothetical protein